MHFDGLCRRLGAVDPGPIAEAVAALGEDAWREYERRQQMFDVHAKTQTIPLLYDEDLRHSNPTRKPRLDQLQPVLQPVLDVISGDYRDRSDGNGYFIRIILTRLSPNSLIPPHRDGGPSLLRSHRHHIAITSNPLVDFIVGEQPHYFAPGEVWEINNREEHEVRNRSNEPRIHLIVDYVVPGERIDDPNFGTVHA